MRRSARFTASMQDMVRARVGALREHLVQAQRELQAARNAAVTAIGLAAAAGAEDEDLVQLRAAKDALDASAAGEQLRQLEDQVETLLPRTPAG